MATRRKANGDAKTPRQSRYFLSFDLGLMGDYNRLYRWLDSHGAIECCSGLATLTSTKTRDGLATEVRRVLRGVPKARAYIISLTHGGRFIVGTRKAAPWEGFAPSAPSSEDES